MSDSLDTQLSRVQSAIAKIEEGGQDVTYEGRRVTRGDLEVLYRRETTLLARVSRAARGGIQIQGGIPE
jgi:hypothetical protein